jgi:hypothetical protein
MALLPASVFRLHEAVFKVRELVTPSSMMTEVMLPMDHT